MSDAEYLRVKKDLIWNIGLYTVVSLMLLVEWYFAYRMFANNLAVTDAIKIMTLATGIPAFVLIVAWNDRISKEAAGTILAAAVGFALGKIG